MANHFRNPHTFTPYLEQMHNHRNRISNHYAQSSITARPVPSYSVNPAPDQERIITALKVLTTDGIPPSVIEHLISRPPKCIEACIFLLQQVQLGVDIGWIGNVTHSLHDSESVEATTTHRQQSRQVQRDVSVRSHRSYWSGTTVGSGGVRHPLGQQPIAKLPSEVQASTSISATHPLPPAPEEGHINAQCQSQLYQGSPASGLIPSVSPSYLGTPSHDPGHSDLPAFTNMPWLEVPTLQTEFQYQDDGFGHSLDDPQALMYTSGNAYHTQDDRPATAHFDQQSRVFDDRPRTTSSVAAPPQPLGMLHSHQSLQSSDVSYDVPAKRFIDYTPPPPPMPVDRSPCPRCDRYFSRRTEFVSHVLAEHDRPVQFYCRHPPASRHQSLVCGFTTCRSAEFSKHHTKYHTPCGWQTDGAGVPSCRQETYATRPKRVWGCWFCPWATSSLNSWVVHHMGQHIGRPRNQMSVTWLIKSLLSQDLLRALWQNEIEQLEASTGRHWDIKWSNDPDNELIQELETGFWGKQDFHADAGARQGIVKAAMDATSATKVDIGPVLLDDKRTGKRPPTSSPTGTRRHRSFCRALSLRTQKSKTNLDQQVPAMPDEHS